MLENAQFASFKSTKEKSLGNYKIVENIGAGWYGVVYLGIDKDSNEKYAIKCINKQRILLSLDKKNYEHLLTEIRVMKIVWSKHVIKLFKILQD